MPETKVNSSEAGSDLANPDQLADLHCPLCSYSLRGLSEPRCPECGYRFTWAEVRDPSLRLHPWVFEHHPERNMWSFFRTEVANLRPGRFWRSVTPTQPSNPRRLVLYWAIGNSVVLFACLVMLSIGLIGVVNDLPAQQKRMATFPTLPARPPSVPVLSGWISSAPIPPSQVVREVCASYAFYGAFWPFWVPAAWPWVSCAALMVFHISMRRARVRPIHLVRVCVYCFDLPFWWGLLILATALAIIPSDGLTRPHLISYWPQCFGPAIVSFGRLQAFSMLAYLIMAILSTWRLRTACKYYLRFSFPLCTAVAVQVIAFLSFASMALLPNYF